MYIFKFLLLDSDRPDRTHEFRHTNPDIDKLNVEYISLYGNLGENVHKDFIKYINSISSKILRIVDVQSIEEVAEFAQRSYSLFNQRVNNSLVYKDVPSDVKEELLEFFEKFAMTSLYR